MVTSACIRSAKGRSARAAARVDAAAMAWARLGAEGHDRPFALGGSVENGEREETRTGADEGV